MFILSAKTLSQTYRRLRYVREYADYQRLQGEEILKKQEQVNQKKTELQQVKKAKASLLKEREVEKEKLENQEKEKKTLVANLQKKQRGLQNELNKKRREADQLNARIDRLIAEEIAPARPRAAAAARPPAAARKRLLQKKRNRLQLLLPKQPSPRKRHLSKPIRWIRQTGNCPVALSTTVVNCQYLLPDRISSPAATVSIP